MNIRYRLTGTLLAVVAGSAMAQSAPSTQLDPADVRFIQEAGTAGENEVALGQLGSTNGKSGDTQSFGRQMVTDHTRANEKLTAIAVKKKARPSQARRLPRRAKPNASENYPVARSTRPSPKKWWPTTRKP